MDLKVFTRIRKIISLRVRISVLLALAFYETTQSQTELYQHLIWSKSKKYAIDPYLFAAIVEKESRGDPDAVSSKDCRGLAQLNIYTARMYDPYLIRSDLHDIETNLEIAAQHIRSLQNSIMVRFHSLQYQQRIVLIAAAYNAGLANVLKYNGIPEIKETRLYVKRVQKHYLELVGHSKPIKQRKEVLRMRSRK